MKYSVVIVLTDGWSHKRNAPSAAGIARIKTLAKTITSDRTFEGRVLYSIIGGWPDVDDITFAEFYLHYLMDRFSPPISARNIMISDNTNNTVDDLIGFMKKLRELFGIDAEFDFHIISKEMHFKRITKTVRKLGATPYFIDSHEDVDDVLSLSWLKDVVLLIANKIDPLWKMKWIGGILRAQADRRAEKYWQTGE